MTTLQEIHDRILFLLDYVNSPRFEVSDLNQAVNIAVDQIVQSKYSTLKQNRMSQTFQGTQKIRDELYTLVKPYEFELDSDLIPIESYPEDYMHLLYLEVVINGNEYLATPWTYDQKGIFKQNSFLKPKLTFPENVYWIESSEGLRIEPGEDLESAKMYYLKIPLEVSETQTELDIPKQLFNLVAFEAAKYLLIVTENHEKAKELMIELVEK